MELVIGSPDIFRHVGMTVISISDVECVGKPLIVAQRQGLLHHFVRFDVGIAHPPLSAILANHRIADHGNFGNVLVDLKRVSQAQRGCQVVAERKFGTEKPIIEFVGRLSVPLIRNAKPSNVRQLTAHSFYLAEKIKIMVVHLIQRLHVALVFIPRVFDAMCEPMVIVNGLSLFS